MNGNERHPEHEHAPDIEPMPDQLRWSLRGLRRESSPTHDLWPGIAARIAAQPRQASSSVAPRMRAKPRYAWLAVAASLLLALGVAWQLHPAGSQAAHSVAGLDREAERMTRDYQAAWHALDARRHPGVDATALHQLDRSAAEVRAALRQDPEARFLFERLQSLYARRLDLSQRLVYSTT
jgi:hypothetical protein